MPALEDILMGQMASPSFGPELRYRWEDSRRCVRVVFADVTIDDSKRVMLLHEFGHLPVFYFPIEDVRTDVVEVTDHHTSSSLKGEASYWTIRVGDRVGENAAWSYQNPLPACLPIEKLLSFFNERVDAIYVDDELVPKPKTIWSR